MTRVMTADALLTRFRAPKGAEVRPFPVDPLTLTAPLRPNVNGG